MYRDTEHGRGRTERWQTAEVLISVDDHLIEPPDLFEGRLPAALADRAPRVVTTDDGTEAWELEGRLHHQIGLNAVSGRPKKDWSMEPASFADMRRGCWDPVARLADMDRSGVWASLHFPSLIAGFAGGLFASLRDRELGRACVAAWNDWHHDVWCAADRERMVPLQIPWLHDPEWTAAEVRRNASRGFRALSFPEQPVDMGLPSMHTEHWDPVLRACEETGTVVALHCASSGWSASRAPGAPLELLTSLFPVNALVTCADWLWSGVPVRFPGLRILLAESGIDWVPMLRNRIDYVMDHSASSEAAWTDPGNSPTDVLGRNFYFGVIDLTDVLELRHGIGLGRIVLESDYPHADSTWPDSSSLADRALSGLPDAEADAIRFGNAARLFDWPMPPESQSSGKGSVLRK
jgi:predicted TIM-barrel fold metal-dependent hydrolase